MFFAKPLQRSNLCASHRQRRWLTHGELTKTQVADPQDGGLESCREPGMLGGGQPDSAQLVCEHHSAACRGRSVTLVGAGGWWPDPQLD